MFCLSHRKKEEIQDCSSVGKGMVQALTPHRRRGQGVALTAALTLEQRAAQVHPGRKPSQDFSPPLHFPFSQADICLCLPSSTPTLKCMKEDTSDFISLLVVYIMLNLFYFFLFNRFKLSYFLILCVLGSKLLL